MEEQPKQNRLRNIVMAVTLWLVTAILGLQVIVSVKELFYLVFTLLGGGMRQAEQFALGLIYLLAIAYLVFIIVTTEFHRVRIGKPVSWRVFAWTLVVEVSIILLYILL